MRVGAPREKAASLFQTHANACRGQPPPPPLPAARRRCCCFRPPAWCVVRAPGSGIAVLPAVQGESRDRAIPWRRSMLAASVLTLERVAVVWHPARVQYLAGTRIWQQGGQLAAARTRAGAMQIAMLARPPSAPPPDVARSPPLSDKCTVPAPLLRLLPYHRCYALLHTHLLLRLCSWPHTTRLPDAFSCCSHGRLGVRNIGRSSPRPLVDRCGFAVAPPTQHSTVSGAIGRWRR
jgi:hypothetical protein